MRKTPFRIQWPLLAPRWGLFWAGLIVVGAVLNLFGHGLIPGRLRILTTLGGGAGWQIGSLGMVVTMGAFLIARLRRHDPRAVETRANHQLSLFSSAWPSLLL